MKNIVQIHPDPSVKLIVGGPAIVDDDYPLSPEIVLETWAVENGYVKADPAPAPAGSVQVLLWRVRAILDKDGLLSKVDKWIAGLPDGVRQSFAAAWEYDGSSLVSASSKPVLMVAQGIGLDAAQVSSIIERASRISLE